MTCQQHTLGRVESCFVLPWPGYDIPMFPRNAILPFVIISLLPLSPAAACNIPVFRYALERWPADPYRVIVFHRDPLSATDQGLVEKLQAASEDRKAQANFSLDLVNVSEPLKGPLEKLWQGQANSPLPWVVLHYPAGDEERPPPWAGKLTAEAVKNLIDSPARAQLTDRLLKGDAIVWLLLESGSKQADDAAAQLLQTELLQVEKTIKLPEDAGKDTVPLLTDLPLHIRFSLVRISRNDPTEKLFVAMLLGTDKGLAHPTLPPQVEKGKGALPVLPPGGGGLALPALPPGGGEVKDPVPIAFPIFGRGRVLAGLAGKEINPQTLKDVAAFLCGACSCEVKRANPGIDLLLAADWQGLIKEPAPQEPEPPSQVGEAIPIPHPTLPHPRGQGREGTTKGARSDAHPLGLPRSTLLVAVAVAVLLVIVTGTLALRLQRRQPQGGATSSPQRDPLTAPLRNGGNDGAKANP